MKLSLFPFDEDNFLIDQKNDLNYSKIPYAD